MELIDGIHILVEQLASVALILFYVLLASGIILLAKRKEIARERAERERAERERAERERAEIKRAEREINERIEAKKREIVRESAEREITEREINEIIEAKIREIERQRAERLETERTPKFVCSSPPPNSRVSHNFLTHSIIGKVVEKEFKELPEGHILFNVNKEMKVGVSEEAKAYIAKNLSQIQEQVESYCLDRKIDTIKISPKMKVSLTGDNFKIRRVTESVQSVLNGRLTTWEWIIKPLEAGTQRLTLNVYVIIEIPSYLDRDIHMITKKEDIEVKVNPKYLLGRHTNTILTIAGIIVTLIVGIATVILTNK